MIKVISNEKGERPVQKFDLTKLNSKTISNEDAEIMVRSVSYEEVKAALYDICDNKAPRTDGYTAKFYKKGDQMGYGDILVNFGLNPNIGKSTIFFGNVQDHVK
nr:hypothetical protein [Tanacetum cinerariifolium]GFA85833.1 hypothetical protein [Tanacetum cinerariifolium]